MRARDREKRRIFNDSKVEYREEFQGREIVIPARGSIVMTRREAVMFLGSYQYFDKERSSGEKSLHWEELNKVQPTQEEEQQALTDSVQTTSETGHGVPMKEAEATLEAKAIVEG